MTALLAERAAEVVSAAQQLLTKRMGAAVKLSDPIELSGSGRTTVLRVRVADTFSLPRTLIVKQVRGGADERRIGGLAP
ncbi:MAG: kinase, partial [Nocardia sp.]|nr:kinase [Nocardia sp.]